MQEMTAIAITSPGGPEVLKPVQLQVPVPGRGEVLVKVGRRASTARRAAAPGRLSPATGRAETPGLEIAGEVVGLGPGVKRWEAGDRVCALVPGGGYAEFAVVHEDNALPVPPACR